MPKSARPALPAPGQLILLPSAARTADASAEFAPMPGVEAVRVHVHATAKSSTPSVVFNVEGYDEACDCWETLLSSAAVTDAGDTGLTVGPSVTASANVAAIAPLYPIMRVRAAVGDADSLTYSVSVTGS